MTSVHSPTTSGMSLAGSPPAILARRSHSAESAEDRLVKRPRNRPWGKRGAPSCTECQRRKVRCDHGIPCGQCLLRNAGDACKRATGAESEGSAAQPAASSASIKTSSLDAILERVGVLERTISSLPSERLSFGSGRQDSAALRKREQSPEDPIRTAALELLVLGRRAEGNASDTAISPLQQEQDDDSPRLDMPVVPDNTTLDQTRQCKVQELLALLGPDDMFDMFYRRTGVGLRFISALLPTRQQGEVLIGAYADKADWLHRCVHMPTFLQQCNVLWQYPRDTVLRHVSLPFVGVYVSACLLGLQFMDDQDRRRLRNLEMPGKMPDLLRKALRSAMWGSDFMGHHNMEHLQTIINYTVFMNNQDRSDAAWAYLGSAMKIAQALGLGELVDEASATGSWPPRWSSLVQREVGRRIWWNLLYLDLNLAPKPRYSCASQLPHFRTALPANIDDNDLSDSGPFCPQPANIRTKLSYQIARFKLARAFYLEQGATPFEGDSTHAYERILKADTTLGDIATEVLGQFRDSPSSGRPEENLENAMIQLAVRSYTIKLHRPYLFKGYQEENFAYSKERCLHAARETLRLANDDKASALETWWIPVMYVSVAAWILMFDLLRLSPVASRLSRTQETLGELRRAAKQLRRVSHISRPSRMVVKVLDALLAEYNGRQQLASSSSRSTPEADLRSVVDRVMRKALKEPVTGDGTPQDASHRQNLHPTDPASALQSSDFDNLVYGNEASTMAFNQELPVTMMYASPSWPPHTEAIPVNNVSDLVGTPSNPATTETISNILAVSDWDRLFDQLDMGSIVPEYSWDSETANISTTACASTGDLFADWRV